MEIGTSLAELTLMRLRQVPEWMSSSACGLDPERPDPFEELDERRMAELCRSCPVAADCRAHYGAAPRRITSGYAHGRHYLDQ